MDRLLRPERLDVDSNSTTASSEWKHWRKTFENFLSAIVPAPTNKLTVLTNYVSPRVFECFAECPDYSTAMSTLESLYVKIPNEVFERHLLATRRQQPNETLDEFVLSLKILSKDCNFKAVDATTHRDQLIRDSFISGIRSSIIRQRLLENKTLDLSTAIDQARALDSAMKNSEMYSTSAEVHYAAAARPADRQSADPGDNSAINCSAASSDTTKCFFC